MISCAGGAARVLLLPSDVGLRRCYYTLLRRTASPPAIVCDPVASRGLALRFIASEWFVLGRDE